MTSTAPARVLLNANVGEDRFAFDITDVLRTAPFPLLSEVFHAVQKSWHSREILGDLISAGAVSGRRVGPAIGPLQHKRWSLLDGQTTVLWEKEHYGVRVAAFDRWIAAHRPAFLTARVIENPVGYNLSPGDSLGNVLMFARDSVHGWGVTGARTAEQHERVIEGLRLLGWMFGPQQVLSAVNVTSKPFGYVDRVLGEDFALGWERAMLYLRAGFGYGEACAREKSNPASQKDLEFLAALAEPRDLRFLAA